jgi:hypothetical protein
VPKMTGTVMVCLATASARLAIVEDTHSGVKEATNTGLAPIVRPRVCNLYDRPLLNLFRSKDAKLNPHHGLNVRIWAMDSGRHLSSVIVGGF